jgi:hypothetical protein
MNTIGRSIQNGTLEVFAMKKIESNALDFGLVDCDVNFFPPRTHDSRPIFLNLPHPPAGAWQYLAG